MISTVRGLQIPFSMVISGHHVAGILKKQPVVNSVHHLQPAVFAAQNFQNSSQGNKGPEYTLIYRKRAENHEENAAGSELVVAPLHGVSRPCTSVAHGGASKRQQRQLERAGGGTSRFHGSKHRSGRLQASVEAKKEKEKKKRKGRR